MFKKFKNGTFPYESMVTTGGETGIYYTPVNVEKSRPVKKQILFFFCKMGILAGVDLRTQKTDTAKWYTHIMVCPTFFEAA